MEAGWTPGLLNEEMAFPPPGPDEVIFTIDWWQRIDEENTLLARIAVRAEDGAVAIVSMSWGREPIRGNRTPSVERGTHGTADRKLDRCDAGPWWQLFQLCCHSQAYFCDLVGCAINSAMADKRVSLGQISALPSPLATAILMEMPDVEDRTSIRAQTLLARFGAVHGEDAVCAQIKSLKKRRFAQTTSRGTLQKVNGWMPLRRRLVALELKINRVSDALHQAANNLGFADESYVGLPKRIAERLVRSRSANEFRRLGVGIVGVGRHRCSLLLDSRSRSSAQSPVLQTYFTDRFWRRYLQTMEH